MVVSQKSERQTKSVEQCKNKVDNLKKRYKLERHRMTNSGNSPSNWPWFKRMEQIVGNSVLTKATSDDDRGVSSSGITPLKSKRFENFGSLSFLVFGVFCLVDGVVQLLVTLCCLF